MDKHATMFSVQVWMTLISWFSWWWAHGGPKHVEKRNKHTLNRTVRQVCCLQRLCRDARSTEHKIMQQCLYTLIVSMHHEHHTQTSSMWTNCNYKKKTESFLINWQTLSWSRNSCLSTNTKVYHH